jgi:hypothetical protein
MSEMTDLERQQAEAKRFRDWLKPLQENAQQAVERGQEGLQIVRLVTGLLRLTKQFDQFDIPFTLETLRAYATRNHKSDHRGDQYCDGCEAKRLIEAIEPLWKKRSS